MHSTTLIHAIAMNVFYIVTSRISMPYARRGLQYSLTQRHIY